MRNRLEIANRLVVRIRDNGDQMLLAANHGRGRTASRSARCNSNPKLQRWAAIPLFRTSPTLVGRVQNGLAIGDDLEREAKRIEHRPQWQGNLAQKGIFNKRMLVSWQVSAVMASPSRRP